MTLITEWCVCEECLGKGIFYFTNEESLYHSQVCGQCHGVGKYTKIIVNIPATRQAPRKQRPLPLTGKK